jgi:hypothetical protein
MIFDEEVYPSLHRAILIILAALQKSVSFVENQYIKI